MLNLLLTVLVVTKGCDKIRRNQGYQSTVHSVLDYGSYCVLRYCVGEISVSEKCNGLERAVVLKRNGCMCISG